MNECYRRRAKNAGIEVKSPKDRLSAEEETDSLSEQLGDGVGVWAKGSEEIKRMSKAEVEAEAEEAWEEVKRSKGRKASRLPLMLMLLCFSGQAVEGSTAVVEHQDKNQAAGLELAESFILCGHQAFKTHIKNIAVCFPKGDRTEVAHTRLEAVAGADIPCSLITIFGGDHLAIKAGGAVYVTRWLGGQEGESQLPPARGSGAETGDIVSLAQGKSTKV